MLLPLIIAIIVLMAPITYVALRKLSVVEQQITFEHPQGGVAGLTLVIRDDAVQHLRIAFDDGRVCEVFPAAQHTSRGCTPEASREFARERETPPSDSRLSAAAAGGRSRLVPSL